MATRYVVNCKSRAWAIHGLAMGIQSLRRDARTDVTCAAVMWALQVENLCPDQDCELIVATHRKIASETFPTKIDYVAFQPHTFAQIDVHVLPFPFDRVSLFLVALFHAVLSPVVHWKKQF